MHEPHQTVCPDDGGELVRDYASEQPGVIFHGSGFTVNDFKLTKPIPGITPGFDELHPEYDKDY